MRHHPILLALVLVAAPALAAPPASPAVTFDEVLAMMDTQPAVEYGRTPYRWSRIGQAKPIALAISKVAPTRASAAELVVYGVREGGLLLSALGDSGHSHGPWQLYDGRISPARAHDPVEGAKAWLGVAEDSRLSCAENPPDDQLAALASGDCEHGLRLVRHRAHLVRVALGEETLAPEVPRE